MDLLLLMIENSPISDIFVDLLLDLVLEIEGFFL